MGRKAAAEHKLEGCILTRWSCSYLPLSGVLPASSAGVPAPASAPSNAGWTGLAGPKGPCSPS